MLEISEFALRLSTARRLRGYKRQDTLGRIMKTRGYGGKDDIGLIERGVKEPTDAQVDFFGKFLGMPHGWFTEPNLDDVLGVEPVDAPPTMPEIKEVEDTDSKRVGEQQGRVRRKRAS